MGRPRRARGVRRAVERATTARAARPALQPLRAVAIEAERGWYQEHGRLSSPRSKAVIKAVNALCAELRADARTLVDAFGVPENALGDARVAAEAGRRVRTRLPRAEREQQMLDAARALFAERGYAAVTMDDVAAAVGVTKPLLYTYFGNKERLFLACMEPAGDALADARGRRRAERRATPAEALRAGVHAFFAFVDSDRDAWRVLFDEIAARRRRDRRARRRVPRAARAMALVTAALQERTREPREVEAISTALLGAAEALGALVAAHGRDAGRAGRRPADRTVEPGLEDEMRTTPAGSPSSAATGSRSRARTAPTRTPPTRTCSPRRSTGSSSASALEGERLGEVVAGAVLKHARDFNLTRECVLGTQLAPRDARLRRPAGLRHRPGGGDPRRQQDRARPDRRGHRGRRRHDLRRADRRQRGPARDPARAQPREVAADAGARR